MCARYWQIIGTLLENRNTELSQRNMQHTNFYLFCPFLWFWQAEETSNQKIDNYINKLSATSLWLFPTRQSVSFGNHGAHFPSKGKWKNQTQFVIEFIYFFDDVGACCIGKMWNGCVNPDRLDWNKWNFDFCSDAMWRRTIEYCKFIEVTEKKKYVHFSSLIRNFSQFFKPIEWLQPHANMLAC